MQYEELNILQWNLVNETCFKYNGSGSRTMLWQASRVAEEEKPTVRCPLSQYSNAHTLLHSIQSHSANDLLLVYSLCQG
jgi:hypothetical protein